MTPEERPAQNLQSSDLQPSEIQPPVRAFLFIDGTEKSQCDLLSLVSVFHERNYHPRRLTLERHSESGKFSNVEFNNWQEQIDREYDNLRKKFSIVYLVGFSTSGTLALDLASKKDVAGVLCISTFFSPTRYRRQKILLWMARWLPLGRLVKKLGYDIITELVEKANPISRDFRKIKCPVLLLHSHEDEVASYVSVAKAVKRSPNVKSLLVTFFELDHCLQFHMAPEAICDLTLKFFGLADQKANPNGSVSTAMLCEQLKLRNEESRHWSGILFSLVVGFYTLMGGLLYFTLSDVLNTSTKAPYYLISYSLVTSLYIKLSTLYFFYLNRVDSYIKYHLEPYMTVTGWIAFRTNRWASGRASHIMTPLVTLSEAALTFLISLTLLICTYTFFYNRIFVSSGGNFLLQIGLALAFLLWLAAGYAIWTLRKYGEPPLHAPIVPQYRTEGIEELLDKLYASVEPRAYGGAGKKGSQISGTLKKDDQPKA